MIEKMFQTYKKLKGNSSNYMVYFEGKRRIVKTFREFHEDIETYILKLNQLNDNGQIKNIAIIGPTSYQWLVLDHACIKGGFKSIAIPETYSVKNIEDIYHTIRIDLTLCDFRCRNIYKSIDVDKLYFFNCTDNCEKNFELIKPKIRIKNPDKNLIKEDYTLVFSSGTSERIKRINWNFTKIEKKKGAQAKIKGILVFINYIFSFWSRKDNKIILFMPFSHPVNRAVARLALFQKVNIIISDPINCFKHIITEKPNIMFTVPPVYEAIAQNIKLRIEKFPPFKKKLFYLFNTLKINSLRNKNPIKKLFSILLFKKIKKLYGGKADYFVTGSAPINPEVLKTFYSVGVRVYEAYGQTESCSIISDRRNFRIGSVGRPQKGETMINEDGELLIKYREQYHARNKEIFKKIENGWIYSGDLAYIDKNGFLFILGRKDDTIVLENGKKIHPGVIEAKLKRNSAVNHALVFSPDKFKLNIIVNLSKSVKSETLNKWITGINNELSGYEKITGYCLANEPFTVDNGMLTSTLKMKRKTIVEKFSNEKFERVM
jgi:long-chain acyl-CoA synthetase